MTTGKLRVRSAPSNTGADLHIGNCRTILFNHLFAKKNGGHSVLRIEDSDLARSKQEYADAIAATLDWLGLRADEGYKIGGEHGPYMQTHKLDRYKQVADELVAKGHAYRCYCTQESIDALRAKLPEKERIGFKYPGICRERKEHPEGQEYVIRLKAPTEGFVEWDDLVFGKMVVPNKENFDWVLMRSNGVPLYNFGCCVDDHDQKMTHIIRGRDHSVNTNIQIIIHRLLGSSEMVFGHLPMMLGQDKQKLSKRHGAVSITAYRNAGYSPDAILNYLVKFGWGWNNQEIFSLAEMIEKFDIKDCKRQDGCFDPKKFAVINYEHLKSEALTPTPEYVKHLQPFLQERGIEIADDRLADFIPVIRSRAKTFVEAADLLLPLLSEMEAGAELFGKTFNETNKGYLASVNELLNSLALWNEESLRSNIQGLLQEKGLALKDIGGPLRIALLGQVNSPELFQVLSALGKETSLARIGKALARLN